MVNPEIMSWWADKFSLENYVGRTPSLYVWNDMNEPSVFNGPQVTVPRDALHRGDVEHRELHNAYGYYFHMATADGLLKRGEAKDRPFVLSRAFFSGSQRHGAVWTGDNTAEWEHLRVSVPMILTLGLTGISSSGADVGAFFGNPDTELLVRWYQLGAYYPFFREHMLIMTRKDENLGCLGQEIRNSLAKLYVFATCYSLIFTHYSERQTPVVFLWHVHFGWNFLLMRKLLAMMRHLWSEFGNSLLVQGMYTQGAKHVSVYLPGDESWYDMKTGTSYKGGVTHKLEDSDDRIPSFQRAGTIIPRKDRYRRSSTQMENDPYTLVIALNSSKAAEGELYVDDGKSLEFQKGAYIHRLFTFSNGKLTSSNMAPTTDGHNRFASECTVERIILLGLSPQPNNAIVEPSNHKVDVELGPLLLQRGTGPAVLTIRKPNVRIADDWTIQIL